MIGKPQNPLEPKSLFSMSKRRSFPEHQHRNSSVSLLFAHLVFVVKYRRKVISSRVLAVILEKANAACERLGVVLMEANGESDHLHLMILHGPEIALSKIVQTVKCTTSREVRRRSFPEVTSRLRGDHFWSPSYFVASCGGAPLDTIKKYIRNQGIRETQTDG